MSGYLSELQFTQMERFVYRFFIHLVMTQTAMSLQLSAGVQSILYVILLFSGCYESVAYFLLFFFWFILSATGGILA